MAGLRIVPVPAFQARAPHRALGRVPAAYEVEDKHPGSPEALLPPKARLRGPSCFSETHCIPEQGSYRKSKHPAHNKKKFRTSDIPSKITRQENRTQNEEKNCSAETEPEPTQMLELADQEIKTVIVTAFCVFSEDGEGM